LPWPIVSEIFPARIKEVGIATGVGSQWLWNFMYSFSVSYMVCLPPFSHTIFKLIGFP
jgi:putative copper export protein